MADAVASGPEVCGFRSEHLRGAMELFAAEGWDTYTADPERTLRALTAPGSTTVVAVDGGAVAALVQLQSDGEIQATSRHSWSASDGAAADSGGRSSARLSSARAPSA